MTITGYRKTNHIRNQVVRFELNMKMAVFWVVVPCNLVNFYQTTRRYNPEDNHLRTHRRENLKELNTFKVLDKTVEYQTKWFHHIKTKWMKEDFTSKSQNAREER
jgi:hypothetical protein